MTQGQKFILKNNLSMLTDKIDNLDVIQDFDHNGDMMIKEMQKIASKTKKTLLRVIKTLLKIIEKMD